MPRGVYNRSKMIQPKNGRKKKRSQDTQQLVDELKSRFGSEGTKQLLRDLAKSKITIKTK